MTIFHYVAVHYDIGNIVGFSAIEHGNSSKAMLIESTQGKFVLRKLRNEQQAWIEYEMVQALASVNISPSIVQTKYEIPYITYNNEIYNLQIYIEDLLPRSQSNIDFVRLGQVIDLFHRMTNHLKVAGMEDRFELSQLWREVSNVVLASSSEQIRMLAQLTEECLKFRKTNHSVIHGDLGMWNLLFTKESIYIIDFSEVRMDDHHFDLAAVLTSTIPSSTHRQELGKIMADFEDGYVQENADFNRRQLYEQLQVWMLRGFLAVIRERGDGPSTIGYVERKLKLLGMFERILCRIETF
ncbi:phosphotransferase [Paenibacillus sp. FSL H7-689]|uniref:phosphotransferase n=1 Tax=Paenibacillus sp. FSL H7-689 TaxID=1227349 RepID=UPI0003E26FAE|nr:phosphotransferase [Paenibacillus sp. FSL H7-689]ETT54393.1 hypothetical protein C170_04683 [Paenibacillus sp. FSL H7-689]